MATANQSTSENEINQLNLAMRQTPWYQEWFRSKGLNPDQVKLNDQQRKELAQLANQNGYQIGDRMKIDPAGNINQMGGFAGMPTWAKIAIAAAAVAGTGGALGAAGIGPMAGMMGGGGGTAIAPSVGIAGLNTGTLATIPGVTTGIGSSLATASLPTLGSTALTTGLGTTPSLVGSTAAAGGLGGVARSGGSLVNRLMSGADKLGDAGEMFGAFANDEANNRINNFNMADRHDYNMLQAQKDRRENESDALKKLSQTSYIKSGGTPYDPSGVKLAGGRSLPSFNFPRAPISDEMKAGAASLESEMTKRLAPGGSHTPQPIDKYTNRGVGEQIGRWGSIGSGILNTALDYFGK